MTGNFAWIKVVVVERELTRMLQDERLTFVMIGTYEMGDELEYLFAVILVHT